MKKNVDYLLVYFIQLIISVLYVKLYTDINLMNPLFIISEIFILILMISLIFLIYLKKVPTYKIENFEKKLFRIFLLIALLPIIINIYINFRVLRISSVNEFKQISWHPDGKYIIDKDIDFKNANIKGTYIIEVFHGKLDGKGHTIYNLDKSLFGYTTGEISNLNFIDVNINLTETSIGALARSNVGKIMNVHVSGNITGDNTVGGLVGSNSSIIMISSFQGNINGDHFVGGISGVNNGIIRSSYTEGEINGKTDVGGITGYLSGSTVNNCYSLSNINGGSNVGGIVGRYFPDQSTINSSFFMGNIKANEKIGVIGYPSYPDDSIGLMLGKIESDSYHIEPNIYYGSQMTSIEDIPPNQIFSSSMLTKEWFVNVLKLDQEIWNFSPLENNQLPIIKGIKNQPNIKIDN